MRILQVIDAQGWQYEHRLNTYDTQRDELAFWALIERDGKSEILGFAPSETGELKPVNNRNFVRYLSPLELKTGANI